MNNVQAQGGDRDLWCDIWLNERYLGEGLHQLAVSHGWREHDIVITYRFAAAVSNSALAAARNERAPVLG